MTWKMFPHTIIVQIIWSTGTGNTHLCLLEKKLKREALHQMNGNAEDIMWAICSTNLRIGMSMNTGFYGSNICGSEE